MVMETYLLE